MFLRTARLVYSSLTFFILLSFASCWASAHASTQNQFEQKLAEIEQSGNVVGLAVAVVRDGEISFLHTYGVQAIGSPDKITEQTTFRIASLSKAFAASVAVQLDAEEKLSLNDRLLDSNPSFKLKKPNSSQSSNTQSCSQPSPVIATLCLR